MGPEVFVQHTGLHIGALDRLEVFAWRLAAQLPVGSVGDGRLVDNAVPFAPVITLLFAVFLGENVMDINIFRLVNSKVHVSPTDKVLTMIFQNQSHDPLVCSGLSGLHRKQTKRIKIRFLTGLGEIGTACDPVQNLNNIVCIAGFVGRTI